MTLTPKQQRFVDEYMIDLNGAQAAIRAGYSARTARQIAEENLSKPDIASAIAERRAALANKADYGLTYHRPKFNDNLAKIMVSKVRMGLPGRRDQVDVTFDFRSSTFRAIERVASFDELVEVTR